MTDAPLPLDKFYALLNHTAGCLAHPSKECVCTHDDAYLAYKTLLESVNVPAGQRPSPETAP